MTALTEGTIGDSIAATPHADGPFAPIRSRGERLTSFTVTDFPVPSGREEDWRFTPTRRLGRLFADDPGQSSLRREIDVPDKVTVSELTVDEALALGLPEPSDRASVLAAARSAAALWVDVPAETTVSEPVRLRLTGTGEGTTREHLVVTVGKFAQVTVILEHVGTAECSELVSLVVADGAELVLVSVQQWEPTSVHLSEQNVRIGRDAKVKHVVASFGGDLVRVSTNVRSTAPGGTFEGLGVFFSDAGQHLENRLFIDHAMPHCTSRVEYKGALQGAEARSVWIGDVLIRAEAEGTDTYELNRNLVLSEGARADSVPNLEIESGEIVGAGHASATGRFDDEQMFYLQARGIPEAAARRLVVQGFFAGIISHIGVPDVRDRLLAALDAELGVVGSDERDLSGDNDD